MFYQLPPVGNPVCLSPAHSPEVLLKSFSSDYQAHYFASGTAALAAAVTAAVQLKSVAKPEVVLPAYGCPDLISAVVFAGAKPVLVDIEKDRPWLDLEQVSAKLSAQTVAIIAVNLFGITERLDALRGFAEQVDAVLIEDSAQAFPMQIFSADDEQNIGRGDLVVLSFGRGKPVSLLGGGAVLCREAALAPLLPKCAIQASAGLKQRLGFSLKATAYNCMVAPQLYWLPQLMPFLHLGETRYHPLYSIEGMDPLRLAMLPSNVNAYQKDAMFAQKSLVTMLAALNLADCGITDLPRECHSPQTSRWLRYPLLCKQELREPLYKELLRKGLGPSRMYRAVLPEIPGLESLLSGQGIFPAAASFAERLLTLPTHQRVNQVDIDEMCQVLSC